MVSVFLDFPLFTRPPFDIPIISDPAPFFVRLPEYIFVRHCQNRVPNTRTVHFRTATETYVSQRRQNAFSRPGYANDCSRRSSTDRVVNRGSDRPNGPQYFNLYPDDVRTYETAVIYRRAYRHVFKMCLRGDANVGSDVFVRRARTIEFEGRRRR